MATVSLLMLTGRLLRAIGHGGRNMVLGRRGIKCYGFYRVNLFTSNRSLPVVRFVLIILWVIVVIGLINKIKVIMM